MAGTGNGALMRYGSWGVCLALLAWMLVACAPQTLVTQPNLTLHIHNEAGEALPAVTTLYWWEYPHHRQRGVAVVTTGMQGTVLFSETTASEVIMPLAPHGVPAYNWSFCIESEAYKTLIGSVSNVEPGAKIEVDVTLHTGQSSPVCVTFERLHNHPGTPVTDIEFSGGIVDGVYEVETPLEADEPTEDTP